MYFHSSKIEKAVLLLYWSNILLYVSVLLLKYLICVLCPPLVLDFFRWLVFKARVQRTASRSTLRALEGEARESRSTRRESFKRESCTQARCFKQSDLDIAHRRLIESECWYGAEPPPCPWFLPSLHLWRKINFYPGLNSYQVYTFIISPHSLSYWFIHFCTVHTSLNTATYTLQLKAQLKISPHFLSNSYSHKHIRERVQTLISICSLCRCFESHEMNF